MMSFLDSRQEEMRAFAVTATIMAGGRSHVLATVPMWFDCWMNAKGRRYITAASPLWITKRLASHMSGASPKFQPWRLPLWRRLPLFTGLGFKGGEYRYHRGAPLLN